MTVALRVCPLGKLGDVSYGGTASDSGGRARPMRDLPVVVMASDPAAAISMSTSGVRERQRQTITSVRHGGHDGHPHRPPDVGVERDRVVQSGRAPRDGLVEDRLVEPGDALGLGHRVVDLGRHRGERHGHRTADEGGHDQHEVGRTPSREADRVPHHPAREPATRRGAPVGQVP